ncbi:MAG: alanine racemase [Devosia sp.]|uniref:alanine racemase n=1 Tax=Devosia sp. TaxID=1871048 RepID=UPI001AD07338|nr:alanine racemase [Devosia sp.]MBN9317015.1 alanine racemase [Devosia sp.]
MGLNTLETPALILDRAALLRNTTRMTDRFRALGVRLRPHTKTSKSIDVVRLALAGNFGGVTVSTLREAEYFAGHGIGDITYAVSIIPDKLERVAALIRRGVQLTVITDQIAVAEEISSRAVTLGIELDVLIELDSGEKRAGVMADSTALIELGKVIHHLPALRLAGVLTHAGHSYQGRSLEAIRKVAEEERLCATTAAERLRAAGLPAPVVSVGSTPTATHGVSFEGITEVRCGVYMFGDVFQSEIASLSREDIAVSVLATIIGHRPDMNSALVDAGALALSKDRSTGAPGLAEDIGFGLVMDVNATRRIDGVTVGHVYQEHGMLVSDGPFPFDQLPVGTRVRILPNHACMTAAMHEAYHVVDGSGMDPVATWPRINGW